MMLRSSFMGCREDSLDLLGSAESSADASTEGEGRPNWTRDISAWRSMP